MPFQKGVAPRRAGGTRTAGFTAPSPTVAVTSDESTATVEPEIDVSLESDTANEISRILRTPIVCGGKEDEEEDARESYNEQSYANDKVHEEWFDTSERAAGPLHLPIEKIEIDGQEYKIAFVRCKIGGEPDTAEMRKHMMAGWTTVPVSKLPKQLRAFSYKSDLGDELYIVGDVVLMMIPMSLYNKIQDRDIRRSDAAMRRVDQYTEFTGRLQQGIRPITQKPTRQTIQGRHATAAVQDALEEHTASVRDREGASGHTLRGFSRR